jgi:hypothetical protein
MGEFSKFARYKINMKCWMWRFRPVIIGRWRWGGSQFKVSQGKKS